jgi:hypothetical protein
MPKTIQEFDILKTMAIKGEHGILIMFFGLQEENILYGHATMMSGNPIYWNVTLKPSIEGQISSLAIREQRSLMSMGTLYIVSLAGLI